MISFFTRNNPIKRQARDLYDQAEAQGRLPAFYEELGVPDTVDGRFEMIALHCYILIHRLQKKGEKKLSQALFDVLFKQMDLSLREMGVGDLGVPKHMKRMMQGFNGRALHYEAAVNSKDREELKHALVQNIYGTVDRVEDSHVEAMADYVLANIKLDNGFEINFKNKEASSRLRA